MRGFRRLQSGQPLRRNRAHTDLWLQISDVLADWEGGVIKIVKVVSHCAVGGAQDPLGAWAYWHNHLVDEAANAANNRRSEAFWHDRRALETALVWHRGLHRAILRNLLQQARQTVMEQKPDTPTVEETAPNLVEQVTVVPQQWTVPVRMVARKGPLNTTKLKEWWSAVSREVLGGSGPLVFVSGLQLHLDFFLCTGHFGPWIYKKRWFDTELLAPQAAKRPWGERTKHFLSLWKGVLKANEVSVVQKLTRPSSSAISRWLVCYKLRYSPTRLKELDAVILRIAGRQLVTSQDVAAFNPQVER